MAKIKGLRQYIEVASKEIVSTAAKEIATDLKKNGPYWSGHFESQWVVVPGAVDIPATSDHDGNRDRKPRTTTSIDIPKGHKRLTIGNRAKYRDIALDLLPGRVKDGKNNTAPQDWFVTYTQGGGIRNALQRAIRKARKSRL